MKFGSAAFQPKNYLATHIRRNHVTKEKKHLKCANCVQTFSIKNKLTHHIKTVHERIKAFKCDTCNATFPNNGNLKRHVTSIHNHDGKRPFKCNMCDSDFKLKEGLHQHIKIVHEGKKSICDSTSVHERLKPFKCTICDYECSDNGSLKNT